MTSRDEVIILREKCISIGNKRIPLKKSLCQNQFTRKKINSVFYRNTQKMQTTILGLHYLGLRQTPVFLFMFIKVQTLLLGDFSLLKSLNDRLRGLQLTVRLRGPLRLSISLIMSSKVKNSLRPGDTDIRSENRDVIFCQKCQNKSGN